MSTASRTTRPAPADPVGLRPYRLTVRQFEKMIAAGVFPAGAWVELIAGILATKNVRSTTTYIEGVPLYRLTVRQFEKMIAAGVFPEDARVELLGGVPARKMTKHPSHDFTVDRLGKTLGRLLPSGWIYREEKTVTLVRFWRPEPDIAVVRGPDDRYRKRAPALDDLALVVEVSESTYRTDRGVKWVGYAAAGVPCYWVVDLSKRVVEVYTRPAGRGRAAKYRDLASFGAGSEAPVVIEGQEVGKVSVNDMLP